MRHRGARHGRRPAPGRRAPGQRHARDARPSRARRAARGRRPARRDRGPAALDHRPRHGEPAPGERGRHDPGQPERRDLQLRRAASGAARPRPHAAHAGGHRDHRPAVRGLRRPVRRAPARDVRDRDLGLAPQAPRARPRPAGQEADLLDDPRRPARLGLRAQGAAGRSLAAARARPRGARPLPPVPVHPGAGDDPPRRPQARARVGPRRGRPARSRSAATGRRPTAPRSTARWTRTARRAASCSARPSGCASAATSRWGCSCPAAWTRARCSR